jgi:UDP-N-acetylglucosamine 2-epimerase (non-hydrolysing)
MRHRAVRARRGSTEGLVAPEANCYSRAAAHATFVLHPDARARRRAPCGITETDSRVGIVAFVGEIVLEGLPATPPEQTPRKRASRAPGIHLLIVAGTRPECIKLAPIVRVLRQRRGLAAVVVNSGQHPEAVRRTFAEFDVACDRELPALPAAPNLAQASLRLTHTLAQVVGECRPAVVLVQGDTLTAYAGTRAGAASGCPVVHVEAGLRAPSVEDPFPEEWFRRRIARHARWHFAPCDSAYLNLVAEGTPLEHIRQVGNTGIDSLRALLAHHPLPTMGEARGEVLVTLHRRENWDSKADVICDALLDLAHARPELRMRVPVHPNPRIAPRLRKRLSGCAQFTLAAPLAYREFIAAVARAPLVISDSGGVQEEVPHLGVPLLVPRSCTERPEGVATGFVRIVEVSREAIVREALALLAAPRRAPLPFDADAPFGDGTAASRIVDVLEAALLDTVAA